MQLRGELLAAMAADPSIDVFDYRVAVAGGEIHLRGETRSEAEKGRAEKLARRMAGVRTVHNDVVVLEELREIEELEQIGQSVLVTPRPLSDPEIRRTIIDRFMSDNRVMIQDQAVSVQKGQVALSGKILNLKQRKAAIEVARSVPGVKSVEDRLTLGLAKRPSDRQLRDTILSILKLDPYFDPENVRVTVSSGVVSLSGIVSSARESVQLSDTISEVRGVTAIQNQLKTSG